MDTIGFQYVRLHELLLILIAFGNIIDTYRFIVNISEKMAVCEQFRC
jgi:hypothetical protein